MRALFWAMAERLLPRASTALVMLAMTLVLSPASVGLYASAALVLTLILAVSDVPARQLAVLAIRSESGASFLARYRVLASVCGVVVMSGVLVALAVLSHRPAEAVQLVPMALVPVVAAANVAGIARLQARGRWRHLASVGAVSAGISLASATALLLATGNLLGAAVQALALEAATWCLLRRHGPPLAVAHDGSDATTLRREYAAAAGGAGLGWLQGQGDRAVVALVAGPAALAVYQLAWSISRAATDAVATSSANVLRSELGQTRDEVRAVSGRIIARTTLLAGAAWAGVAVVALVVLPLVVPPAWDSALLLAPVIGLSGILTAPAWSCTSVLMAQERTRDALPARVLGALLCVPVGLLAVYSLEIAAWAAVLREAIILSLMRRAVGRAVPARPFLLASLLVIVGALALLLLEWRRG